MAFDFSKISGESFGDINDVFFKKNGKSILPQPVTSVETVSVDDITKNVASAVNDALQYNVANNGNTPGVTVIQISKDVLGTTDDVNIALTQMEERRRNTSSVRNKHFIDINSGDEVTVLDHNEMYNGMNLFTVRHETNAKVITYPRSMFVGNTKRFVPRDFYIREAERSIEDTVDKYRDFILSIVEDPTNLQETSDGKYLEVILDESLEILGNIAVPDKVQIPVKRMFDMNYKILMLEYVICLDSKIAALLFIDIWF
jgi:hypothetical protein